MTKLSAWDLDGTIRPGSLSADAIQHGVAEGFVDPTKFVDTAHPTLDELWHFVDAIKHRSRKDFTQLTDRLSDEAREASYEWAIDAIDRQAHPIIISQSPSFLVKAFARGLGVRYAAGSHYHTSGLIFSGHAVSLDKGRTLTRYMRRHGIDTLDFAAGDSESDIPVLERAKRAVVVNPYPVMAEIAIKRHWEIVNVEKP